MSSNQIQKYSDIDGEWEKYLIRSEKIIKVLESAYNLDPSNMNCVNGIILVCKDNIEGVHYQVWDELLKNKVTKVRSVSPEYETVLKSKIAQCSEIIQKADPSYEPPEIKKKTSCCFVITATMGNRYHPHVILLQNFRDSWLITKNYGRAFTRLYNKYGPSFADIIRDRPLLRCISLNLIVKPSVFIVSNVFKFDSQNENK
jgi:hypothetical protein